jgi:hypothetical protein
VIATHLRPYVDYYVKSRTHLSKDKDSPVSPLVAAQTTENRLRLTGLPSIRGLRLQADEMLNSRGKPRIVLSRAVRVVIHVDRNRCKDATACNSVVLIGTA